MFKFLKKVKNTPKGKITDSFIKEAYIKRKKEIDSLKAYDKGEKIITPRNLRSAM